MITIDFSTFIVLFIAGCCMYLGIKKTVIFIKSIFQKKKNKVT